jgi:hypothetical protein
MLNKNLGLKLLALTLAIVLWIIARLKFI